ncbi:MAG: beta-galactosidase, partial [Prevotella sp.]|nr:beta-galactosidase [Prevotella sp.]
MRRNNLYIKNFLAAFQILCFIASGAVASPRIKYSINEDWKFIRQDAAGAEKNDCNDAGWRQVSFPHTWNALDATDDEQGYYKGIAWYRREIKIPLEYSEKQITVFFEGANQEIELFVNGKSAGIHAGGYTRFSFDITDYIRFGENNLFSVKASNRSNENIPPLSADFTFFGGIYRDVYLIITNKRHISTTHYASGGVYFRTTNVSEAEATAEIETILDNMSGVGCDLRVEHSIVNPAKQVVQSVSGKIRMERLQRNLPNIQTLVLEKPELWQPEEPSLYSIYTRIYDERTGEMLD